MTKLSRRITVICGVVLALVPLILFAYLGLHNRLVADDYSQLGLALEIGTWEALLFWREVWHGDYSNFMLAGLLARLGAQAPPLFALFICATAFAGFGWQINIVLTCLRICAHRREIVVVLASLATAAAINGFYHPQVFYWQTAAVEYTWPAVMLLIGIAMAVEAARRLRSNFQHLLAAVATALYVFVNAGFSEMYLGFQLAAVSLIAFFVFAFQQGPKRKSHVILALGCCIGDNCQSARAIDHARSRNQKLSFGSIWLPRATSPRFAQSDGPHAGSDIAIRGA